MRKLRCSAGRMCLVAVLLISSVPGSIYAGDGGADNQRPIRLHASAFAAPIGSVDAFGSIMINGRQALGSQSLWGGELVEAASGSTARVSFESVGQATLSEGASVRFTTVRSSSDEAGDRVLIASLVGGNVSIELQQDAGAYVEAGASRFTALRGASFRVGVQKGKAVLVTLTGTVNSEQTGRPTYKVRPVDDLGRPVDLGRTLSVRARSTRNVQIQVTDENDKPVPDLPILFSLGDPCIGSLGLAGASTFRKNTDNKGIAAVPLVVGAIKCLSSLSANVEGTSASFTQEISVQKSGFWTARNSVLVSAIAAGAAAGAVVAVSSRDNTEPITPVPPGTVRP